MKKDNVKIYASALADIIFAKKYDLSASAKTTADKEKIVNNVTALLVNSGYAHKSQEILDLTQDLLLQKENKRNITLETARNMTTGQKKILESLIKKGDIVKEKINPSLIAGIRITVNHETQFDNSLLGKLNKI